MTDGRGLGTHDAVAPATDPLIGYRLRAVRVGAWVTALTLVVLAAFAALPGHGTVHLGSYTAALIVGTLAVVVVVLLPWARLFETSLGQWAMYVWCAT